MSKTEIQCESTKNVEIESTEECCGICRFHAESGECRRRAPRGQANGRRVRDDIYENLDYDRWAYTEDFEWCGEFEKEVL